jgi:hypothetical protein
MLGCGDYTRECVIGLHDWKAVHSHLDFSLTAREPAPNRPVRVILGVKEGAVILTFILTFRDFGMSNSTKPLI